MFKKTNMLKIDKYMTKKNLKFRKQLICKEYEKEMGNLTANNKYKVNTYIY